MSLDWRRNAACADLDTEDFFPVGTEKASEGARAACAACPVKAECLEYALENREHGWWGGTSKAERDVIWRNMLRRSLKEAAVA